MIIYYLYYMRDILIPMLQRAGARAYSNFKVVTRNGDSPYEELSSSELADMTGYKKSFFLRGLGEPRLHYRYLMAGLILIIFQICLRSYLLANLRLNLNARSTRLREIVLKSMQKILRKLHFTKIFQHGYFLQPSEVPSSIIDSKECVNALKLFKM